jgi:hypothetical protein
VFNLFERLYNVKRRNSTLSYLGPVAFEEQTALAEVSVREAGSSLPWRGALGPTHGLSG